MRRIGLPIVQSALHRPSVACRSSRRVLLETRPLLRTRAVNTSAVSLPCRLTPAVYLVSSDEAVDQGRFACQLPTVVRANITACQKPHDEQVRTLYTTESTSGLRMGGAAKSRRPISPFLMPPDGAVRD